MCPDDTSSTLVQDQKDPDVNPSSEILSEATFDVLNLSPFIMDGLKRMGLVHMTKIQQEAIPPIAKGKNVAAKAHTGSGKTLAFILPALDLIHKASMKSRNGTGVIVLTPTRELALQIYTVAKDIAADHISIGLAIGGTSRQKETEKLAKGANLLIATPGRLRDHLSNSVGFKVKNLFMLVLDEADMLLDLGFEEELSIILKMLPNSDTRQTCLFSATMSTRVLGIKNLNIDVEKLLRIDSDSETKHATRINFEQGFLICPPENRFILLYTFLKRRANKKIIVFLSSCSAVEFYYEFLKYVGLQTIMMLNGNMKQQQRTRVYHEFINCEFGCLVATNVAARGLDIPDVDYIIQFDPPDSVESYIHRAGRACRGDTKRKGQGVLFLMANEAGFIKLLRTAGVPLFEFEFPLDKIINVQEEMERIVGTVYYLRKKAQDAYKTYLYTYATHSLKNIFNINKLDLPALARSFGLTEAPSVDVPGYKPGKKRH